MAIVTNVFNVIKEWFAEREAQKKSDELYYRLHRHDDAKFSEKDYRKRVQEMKKSQMKKNADKQADVNQATGKVKKENS